MSVITLVTSLLQVGVVICMVVIEEQDEAAIRLVDASPDCNEYRPISLLVNFFSGLHCTTSLALS
jgi:hypothetical protein